MLNLASDLTYQMQQLPPKQSAVQYLLVSDEMAGQRIDNFLITFLKGVPKTCIYRILRKGEVRVNKGRIKPDYRLKVGDSIRIPPVRRSLEKLEKKETLHLSNRVERELKELLEQTLYEDNDIVVLNKPAGMAVHGGSGLSFGVIEALRKLKPEHKSLELVHRLDRDTSGCLMIAKRRSALRNLHASLQSGLVDKFYFALVKGDWGAGTIIDYPLKKNQLSSGERIVRVSKEGKESRSEFKVVKRFGFATLMEVKLVTGRTHQIRVHAAHVGHPVAGDEKYGDPAFNRWMKDTGLARLFLHASHIYLNKPDSGKRLVVEAPMDKVLTGVLEKIEKMM